MIASVYSAALPAICFWASGFFFGKVYGGVKEEMKNKSKAARD